jgi:hypothetical protein
MNRYIRHAAFLGAVMLGTACADSADPAESNIVPRPVFIAADQVPPPTARVSGVAWDPEAFFVYLAGCSSKPCPIPPFLGEGIPIFKRSAVLGATVFAFDVEGAQPHPTGAPATSDGQGIWVLPNVPQRFTTPYFLLATGTGSLIPAPIASPPLQAAPVAPTEYLPTLSLRPISTGVSGSCVGQDAAQIGKNGALEAVAKHLTATTGSAVSVMDFVDPVKYWGTNVIWAYSAGNPILRAPADNVSLEVSITGGTHQTFAIDWAPPGVLPPFLNQSTRGFFVTQAPTSPLGLYVVLLPHPPGPPPSSIDYLLKDTVTNSQSKRPWSFPPLHGNIGPGTVYFIGAQMQYPINLLNPPPPPPPYICLPG